MAWGKSRGGGGGCLAGIALIVALAALFVAWSAWRRTGGTFGELSQGVLEHRGGGEDWRSALDQARERLQERRAEVQGERNLEEVRRDVEQIRESLGRTFQGTGDQAREKWRGLDSDLQRLDAQLREGGSRARATLDEVVEKMKR